MKINLILNSNRKDQIITFIKNNIDTILKTNFFLTTNNNIKDISIIKKILIIKDSSLSEKRNSSISNTKNHVAIIDDDCIIDSQWINETNKDLYSNNEVIFGTIKPIKHTKDYTCPATLVHNFNHTKIFNKIVPHYSKIGFTANVLIKKSATDKIGGFKEWLGPGTETYAGEDAEFILRCLISDVKIAVNPKKIVTHLRLIPTHLIRNNDNRYMLGGIVAYGFYYFQGVKECKSEFSKHILWGITNIRNDILFLKKKPFKFIYVLVRSFETLYFIIKGVLIALIYAKIVPIPEKEDVVNRYYKKA